jgi:DNA-binding HxlR family transcriptional regulator
VAQRARPGLALRSLQELWIAYLLTFPQCLSAVQYSERMRDAEEGNGDAQECNAIDGEITRVFTLLGKRWSGVIIAVLMTQGPLYFAELRRATPGISERMLSDRLTELAAAGLLVREVDEGPPLRVSYRLTPAGHALAPAMNELAHWAARWMPETGPCPKVPVEPAAG